MPRRHPGRRRRRPGRWPPNRYRGHETDNRPGGFTGYGLDAFYDVLMPKLRGREKKDFFNRVCGWLFPAAAMAGAAAGFTLLGPFGVVFGLVAGLVAGASFLKRNRFYRP